MYADMSEQWGRERRREQGTQAGKAQDGDGEEVDKGREHKQRQGEEMSRSDLEWPCGRW